MIGRSDAPATRALGVCPSKSHFGSPGAAINFTNNASSIAVEPVLQNYVAQINLSLMTGRLTSVAYPRIYLSGIILRRLPFAPAGPAV